MTAAYTTLELTDGTTTVDLVDGTNYQLVENGWAPAYAPKRRGKLGAIGPRSDVTERITINIMGTSAANVLANLQTLTELLAQAEAWEDGEPVDAVTLQCQPQGSSLSSAVQAVVMGNNGRSLMNLPVSFNDDLMVYEIANVTLVLKRRGLWLGPEENVTGSATTQPAVSSASFAASHAIESPVDVVMDVAGTLFSARHFYSLIVAVANGTDKLVVWEAEDMAGVTNFASQADSGNYASGGNVLRFTPSNTNTWPSSFKTIGGSMSDDVRRIGIFANIRNNAASTNFTVQARVDVANYSTDEYLTPKYLIEAEATTPARWHFLGIVTLPDKPNTVFIDITADAASGTLDIDNMAALAMDGDNWAIVNFGENLDAGTGNTSEVRLYHRNLTNRMGGQATIYQPSTEHIIPYSGDPAVFMKGQTVAALFMASGSTTPDYWRMIDGAGTPVPVTMALDVTRRAGYLVPQ